MAFLPKLPRAGRWGVLFAASAVLAALLEAVGMPAALLLGPMIAAILVETGGGAIRVPRLPHYGAQAVIGCLIAGAISPAIVATFLGRWPLFVGVVLAVVAASALLGWVISRLRIMPGTTAVWGLSPGAAPAMMLMAEGFGADARLVAFMQYLRVVLVACAAPMIARLWVHTPAVATVRYVAWLPPIHWLSFAETLAIGVCGGVLASILRVPAGMLLVPMIAAAALHGSGLVEIELPPWLVAASYAVLGWSIGLSFTREILAHATRTLPQTILAILSLMTFCGGLAFLLVKMVGIDPLTAYLATSPGGLNAVLVIAASTKVNLSFVMALQTVRFVVVLAVGPSIARLVANRVTEEIVPSTAEKSATPSEVAAAAVEADVTLARVRESEAELD